ncbi:Class I peroxidase protein [Dioscorea alata]|uniref:Class I peroxidase protein n=1 Tax=Dioscorea alata TaxID=55571 RepID=A0ACB7U134_DIOAL|nr:Class I peroxidase protein [Dioscorea alata]
MASTPSFFVLLLFLLVGSSSANLSTNFYSSSCPNVFSIIKPVVKSAISAQARNGASLLRLFFHDCFVNGCDASVLLDDTPTFRGEKTAPPNNNSIRGFDVIDKIKARVEKACPGVVSCADILAIAARDSVVILGGPNWNVKVGRRDSRTANFSAASTDIPPPTSNLSRLIANFSSQGLSVKDMVALSGGHTIGKARCVSFRGHIYNDTNIDSSFAKTRQANCPRRVGVQDRNLAPLDRQTDKVFDNDYFKNLVVHKGLLHSDQELYNGVSTDSLVQTYASSTNTFFSDFVTGMIKMGDVKPLTGSKGEIRKNCRRVN